MRGDPGTLYDAHAARLYAYCWSLVGDDAAAAVTDTFAATVQHPPRGDSVLWLYALARSACIERGALDRGFVLSGDASGNDPLLRAAGTLRADHREVLLLEAGEWLEIPDIARVVGIAPDTARQLLNVARVRFERAVLDGLMRGAGSQSSAGSQSMDIIAAFEKGTLPQLLARRVPDQPPAWLRDHTLAAFEGELTGPLPGIVTTNPVVVIGSGNTSKGGPRRKAKSITAVAGIAASAAAAAGLLVSWPVAKGGGASSLLPTGGSGTTESTSDRPATQPNQTTTDRPGTTGKDGGTVTPGQGSAPLPSTGDGGGTPTTQPVPTRPGTTPAPEKGKPSPPEKSPSPPEETPTVPPQESPSEPPTTPPTEDPGTQDPTPTEPTENPPAPPTGEPSPSPSSNPVPTPQG
ncbi:RNA polymerase sigma factor [Actinomadura sp. 6N118]|uniref:RNA polymerase sigma factor n=1 Tax=Actinomadura sp. 6N118 TaxID=3375151 RepID=UPI00378C6CBB